MAGLPIEEKKRKAGLAFWLTVVHAAIVGAVAVVVTFTFQPDAGLDYARTGPLVAFVWLSLHSLPMYLWLCAALSSLASLHLGLRSKPTISRFSGLVYLIVKAPLTGVFVVLAAVVFLLGRADPASWRLFYLDGTTAIFAVDSVNPWLILAFEGFLALPLWLIIGARLRGHGRSGATARNRRGKSALMAAGTGLAILAIVGVVIGRSVLRARPEPETPEADEPRIEQVREELLSAPLDLTTEKVAEALAHDRGLLTARDESGFTLLHLAALAGNAEMVNLLLEEGAEVGATNDVGVTALHVAARNGHAPVVQALLDGGATPSAQTDDGLTPLDHAALFGKGDVASILSAHGAQPSVFSAAALDDAEQLRRLLAQDESLALRRTEHGRTPLHWAAGANAAGAAEVLLSAGADPEARDDFGSTPLEFAAGRGHLAVIEVLLEADEELMERLQ